MADVDPDDGPFDNPPIELIVGLSNVMIFAIDVSSSPIVIPACCRVLTEAADLHFSVVAASHSVASHLMI